MFRNKMVFVILALISGGICAADDKNQTIRTLGEKIIHLYRNSGKAIEKSDLELILDDYSLSSNPELIQSLEQYKIVLEKDILSTKTEKRPSFFWKFLPGIMGIIAGTKGIDVESEKAYQVSREYSQVHTRRSLQLHFAKQRDGFNQSKFDAENPEPEFVPYVMQNIPIYGLLIVGGAIGTLFVAYKLYNYVMYPYNKKKEIALVDEIIAHIQAMQ